jgi:hypothetical protein
MDAMQAIAFLLCLLVLPFAARAQAPLPASEVASALTPIATGKDAAFGQAVAPALSLDTKEPPAARAAAIVSRITQEIERVAASFAKAAPAERAAQTRATVAQFDPETARDGATRSFEGKNPSLSIMRQLLFVPTANAGANPTDRVTQIVSRFEHSPKTDDTYYAYSNPADLRGSQIMELPGSADSWTSKAQPPMEPGKVYALKKCRHVMILGWYCNTALYQVRDIAGAKLLATILRPLPKGADNPKFDDGRRENIVDGYTAAYVVTAAPDLVLVYSIGIQSKAGASSQQGLLNEGHKEEYRQLVSRVQAELGIGKLP